MVLAGDLVAVDSTLVTPVVACLAFHNAKGLSGNIEKCMKIWNCSCRAGVTNTAPMAYAPGCAQGSRWSPAGLF